MFLLPKYDAFIAVFNIESITHTIRLNIDAVTFHNLVIIQTIIKMMYNIILIFATAHCV